ncbi:hypothetical protein C8J57DRAFT_1519757 [Mycena rebaudengoi]|nr:hypothetical protein C8J57DRAFT_1519757 [Mycena rebaudengoi]
MPNISTPFHSNLTVSYSCKMCFSADGHTIVWDELKVQLVPPQASDASRSPHREPHGSEIHEIGFQAGEITDVANHGDDLYVLTRTPSGSKWKRRLRRRSYLPDDQLTQEQLMYSYTLHLFSLERRTQTGEALSLPTLGVKAVIRAGFNKVIVLVAGPQCLASFWVSPTAVCAQWQCLHQEFTWDPEIIARKIGFQSAQEEEEYVITAKDRIESPNQPEYRHHQLDDEILDYTFISENLVLRLRENSSGSDGEYWVEIISVSTPDTVEGISEAPVVATVFLRETYCYHGTTKAFFDAPTIFGDDNCVSVTIRDSEGAHNIILRVSGLMAFVKCPSGASSTCSEIEDVGMDNVVPLVRDPDDPFTCHSYNNLGPVIHGKTMILPVPDIDPASATPNVPIVRFIRFGDTAGSMESIDIPFMSLFPDNSVPEEPRDQETYHLGLPREGQNAAVASGIRAETDGIVDVISVWIVVERTELRVENLDIAALPD